MAAQCFQVSSKVMLQDGVAIKIYFLIIAIGKAPQLQLKKLYYVLCELHNVLSPFSPCNLDFCKQVPKSAPSGFCEVKMATINAK